MFRICASLTLLVVLCCGAWAADIVYSRSQSTGNSTKATVVHTKKTTTVKNNTGVSTSTSTKSKSNYSGNIVYDSSKSEYLRYTIQVGAFQSVDNAANLVDKLDHSGLNPFYFKASDGLYKVRFGNFNTIDDAKRAATSLQRDRVIIEYFILSPSDYAIAKAKGGSSSGSKSEKSANLGYVRRELVSTSKNYLGVPYRWGGSSKSGIDCSGLTQAIYNLNGLSIPRNSAMQYNAGKNISKRSLQPGDLVFFATNGGRRVSHVGVYVGNGKFIHAPGRGKKVRTANLSDKFFVKTYVGARTFI
ncbi:hypothetical protein RsTz2092_09930 [Deferribacterales bacterium RsTz2092]|nr:hypothetical protein AGMMS49941_08940 [Deferribacterales bacterium]